MSTTKHSHDHRHNVERERGPAPTVEAIQNDFRVEVERRFRKFRGVLRESIVYNRILHDIPSRVNQDEPEMEPVNDYDFEQLAPRQVAFQDQIDKWIEEGILHRMPQTDVEDGQHYTSIYATAAYEAGIVWAGEKLEEEGIEVPEQEAAALLSRPIHEDTLEVLYTRTYDNLEGITNDMDQQISQILTRGIIDGENARDLGDQITAEVRDIQRSRGRALARTEVMNAHAESTLNRLDEFNVGEVVLLVHTPCPICAEIKSNEPYSISAARGMIPAHPNCVCSWAPHIT